jgi:NAD(P)-dependent dehydrogenase (short-subunit alcohol dehydrogenase family)
LRLDNQTVLITGSARRVGRVMALAVAGAGGDVIIHHSSSPEQAQQTRDEITALGQKAWVLKSDFTDPDQTVALIAKAFDIHSIDALVNSASIFTDHTWKSTTLEDWQTHLQINLTAPFLLSQAYARRLSKNRQGRIVNILDWRALRPGADHFPYTVSKSGLLGLTKSLAAALAPQILVNGIAFGAILPPSDGGDVEEIIQPVPLNRWADMKEVGETLLFLLGGPAYITGEVIHLDGGRHLI